MTDTYGTKNIYLLPNLSKQKIIITLNSFV